MQQRSDIIGWGIDAPLAFRPGVPRELNPPMPLGNTSLSGPAQQTTGRPAARSPWRPLTPIYATAQQPRGLSGVLRRLAYRIPDYKARRWLLLMAADRVDVIEHNLVPLTLFAGVAAAGFFGIRALARR